MSGSLRLRLGVWYAALLGFILAVTSLFSYSFHSTFHYEDVDRSLVATTGHVLGELRARTDLSRTQQGIELPPVDEYASPDVYVRLFDAEGRILASSANAGHQADADPRPLATQPQTTGNDGPMSWLVRSIANAGQPQLKVDGTLTTVGGSEGRERTRLYALPLSQGDVTWGYLEAGVSLGRLDQSMARLRLVLAVMSLVGLLAALIGGWAIAGSALQPVAAMASTARAIALSRGFSRRLPEPKRRDELGQLGTTFNEMLASLDEAYRGQQRFVADASHELRAPLTAIQGNLELLDRTPPLDGEARAEALAYLQHETRRMSRLVGDLLVLARADAGQPLKVQRVELDRLALEVFRDIRVLAKGQKLSVQQLDQVQVQGDPDRLKQLLMILMNNAIKYTPGQGEVRLGLRAEPGAAAVFVADTGIGIDQEDLPHLFERFYRADKARGRDSGGTGLGLSIAKWIAERHGGQISVESTPGEGSTFTVRLPLLQPRQKL